MTEKIKCKKNYGIIYMCIKIDWLIWWFISQKLYSAPSLILFFCAWERFLCGNLLLLFNHWVMSDYFQPHGLQRARLPCPLPSPGVCSNSCLLSWWRHLTISSSVIRFSSLLRSFPASGISPMSRLFASGGQRIELQLSPCNEYSGLLSFEIDWFDLHEV